MRSSSKTCLALLLCCAADIVSAADLRLRREVLVKKVIAKSMTFSPDGGLAAVSGVTGEVSLGKGPELSLNIANPERVVVLVDPSKGFKVVRRLLETRQDFLELIAPNPVVFAGSGGRVVTLTDDTLLAWDPERGKIVQEGWAGSERNLSSVAFSNDRRHALARRNDGSYVTFDLANLRVVDSFPKSVEAGLMLPVDAETQYVAYLKDRSLTIRRLKTGEETTLGEYSGDKLLSAALSPDGKSLAVADGGGGVALWALGENKKLVEKSFGTKPATDLAFAPDGSALAFAAEGKLHVWSVGDGALVSVDHKHPFGIGRIEFGADPGTIVTTGSMMDPAIKIWDFVR